MKVAGRTVVDEEAGEVGGVETSEECGEERVVERGENQGLGLDVGEARFGGGGVEVNDFESEVGVGEVAETAVEDAGEIAGAKRADEVKMVEVELVVWGKRGGGAERGPERVGGGVGMRGEGEGSGGGGKREGEAETAPGGGGGGEGGGAGEAVV